MPEDDMYGMDEGAGGGSDSPEPQMSEGDEQEKPDENEGQTYLLDKSFFEGKPVKPGEEWVLQVVHDHGDEVEIKYAPSKGSKGSPPGAEGMEGPEIENADAQLQKMAYYGVQSRTAS